MNAGQSPDCPFSHNEEKDVGDCRTEMLEKELQRLAALLIQDFFNR